MATYQKRGRRWRALIRKGGQCVSKSFDSKAEAKDWATDIEGKISRGEFRDTRRLRGRALADTIDLYVIEVNARGTKKRTLERIARDFGPEFLLIDLTPAKVLAFARSRRDAGLAPATVEIARHQLRSEGLTAAPSERGRRLQPGELYALSGYFKFHWMADVIEFTVHSAMRAGEIVRITWTDIDEEKRTVIIHDNRFRGCSSRDSASSRSR